MAAAALTADRLTVLYLVARDHPRPEEVRARMDDAARRLLPAALAAALEPRALHDADEVCLIRRLELELVVGLDTDEAQVAAAWAAHIARELAMMLAGEDGPDLRRFPSRAAYLSRFLADLVEGRAWDAWWNRSFAGLQALPVAVALRTAICEDASVGAEALLALAPSRLPAVLGALGSGNAGRVLAALAGQGSDTPSPDHWDAVWACWKRLARPPATEPDDTVSLLLYVETLRDGLDASGPALRVACVALHRLAGQLRTLPEARAQALAHAVRAGTGAALYRLIGPEDAEAVWPLLVTSPEWRAQVVAALRPGPAPSAATVHGAPRATPFGGAFLLMPLLDELPWRDATAGWTDLGETPAAALARFLVLVAAGGGVRAARAFEDAVLRDLMGIASHVRAATVRPWADALRPAQRAHFTETMGAPSEVRSGDADFLALPPSLGLSSLEDPLTAAAHRLLRAFARRLPGFHQSSCAHLHANFLDVPARLEPGGERDVATLGRPPLHIVLSMTGRAGTEFLPSWRARPLSIVLEGPS